MAIAFDSSGSTDINTSGTQITTLDISAAADGAWVYALLGIAASQGGNVTWTGWTQRVEGDQSTTSHYALYRRQKQAGDTTFTISWPTQQKASVDWVSYTGLDSTAPDELAAAQVAGSATQTTPTLTPNAADRWALAGFYNRSTTAGSNVTWASYTTSGGGTLTERVDHVNGSSRYIGVAMADTGAAVPQAAQSYSATSSPAGSNGAGILLFLIPASGATAVTLNDSGTGADATDISVSAPLADSGTASDSISVSIPIPLSDTGAAAEQVTVTAAVPLADPGGGADTLSVAVTVTLNDSGAATDSISVGIPKPLTDTGTAADTVTTTAQVPLAEVGVGTDTLAVSATVPLSDSGSASDSISVAQIVAKPLADAGSASDSLVVTVAAPLAEVGTAADSLAGTVLLTLADQASATDTLAVAAVAPFTVGTLTTLDVSLATLAATTAGGTLTPTDGPQATLVAADAGIGALTATSTAGGPS